MLKERSYSARRRTLKENKRASMTSYSNVRGFSGQAEEAKKDPV